MIKEYYLNDGSKRYYFKTYLGIDEMTGNKKYTTRRGFKTRKEATTALARLKVEVEENGLPSKKKLYKFEDIYYEWLEQHKINIKTSTLYNIENYYKNAIAPKFHNKYINKITVPYIQKIVNEWSESYKKDTAYVYTKLVFKYAERMGYIDFNPFHRIIKPKSKRLKSIKKNQYLTQKELKEFLTIVKENYKFEIYIMFHLLAYTGIRKGELYSLRWLDFNEITQTLTISRTTSHDKTGVIINTPKTETSGRVISLDKVTINLLNEWRFYQYEILFKGGHLLRNDDQLIFSNLKNELHERNYLNEYLKRITDRFNLKKFTVHGFRHTHASLLLESGATMKQVQDRLGHSDIGTTMNIYAHVTEKQRDDTVTQFAEYLAN